MYGIKNSGIRKTMSGVYNYINIIAIFEKNYKTCQNISIIYCGFWIKKCTIVSITSYLHGTCNSFYHKIMPVHFRTN